MAEKEYIYEPLKNASSGISERSNSLDHPDRFIRLIELYPGGWEERICISLRTVSLNEAPEYEALSYVWGHLEPSSRLWIDDSYLEIGPNLRDALKSLRNLEAVRVLWVDRISINQRDTMEREYQVGLMRHIYKSASTVLIWLGMGNSKTSSAFATIHELSNQMFLQGREEIYEVSLYLTANQQHTIKYPPYDSAAALAVRDLFELPWFSRVWTFQEIVLSQNAVIICGEDSMPWKVMQLFLGGCTVWLQGPNNEDALLKGTESNAMLMLMAYYALSTEGASMSDRYGLVSLMSLLHGLRNFGATDPRDKVFALRNVAIDVKESDLLPDYSKTTAEVYADAAKWIIREQRNLAILSLVEMRDKPDLVSWIPDWRSKDDYNFLHQPIIKQRSFSHIYRASGSTNAELGDESALRLTVRGIRLGRITHRTEPPGNLLGKVDIGDAVHDGGSWQLFARSCAKDGMYAPTGEPIDLAYERLRTWDHLSGDATARRRRKEPLKSMPPLLRGTISFNTREALVKGRRGDMAIRVLAGTTRKRMFVTDTGYLGLAHRSIEVGDEVFVLLGADTPFVLRRVSEGLYILRGETYVHGVMDGELLVLARMKTEGEAQESDPLDSSWIEGLEGLSWQDLPFDTTALTLI